MKLVLLRHVESESNKADKADSQIDAELTEKGKEDAQKLACSLKKYNFDIFIVSPLIRTLQTIQPFLDTLVTPKVITEKLILERDLGNFTGTPMGTFQEYCKKNKLDLVSHTPKNGESILETYNRAKLFLSKLKTSYQDKTILVCGHKNFLNCLIMAIENKDINDYYGLSSIKLGEIKEFTL